MYMNVLYVYECVYVYDYEYDYVHVICFTFILSKYVKCVMILCVCDEGE